MRSLFPPFSVRHALFLLLALAIILLNSCQKTAEPLRIGREYFPLETSLFRIYDVTEQRFSLNGPPTTHTYQLRELISQSYDDPSIGTSFRVERTRRANDLDNWQPDSARTVRLWEDQLIQTENNIPYVKLIFPVMPQKWDGNAYNALGEDEYQLRHTGQPLTVLNQSFAETATVVQQNDSTLVNQDKRLEVYARNVGLIYKETVQLQFCSASPACVGKAQIDYGFRQYLRLRSYGKL